MLKHKVWAQEIVTMLNYIYPENPDVLYVAGSVLTSVGNYQGRNIIKSDFNGADAMEKIRMTDIPTLKQKLEQQYINLTFDPAAALSDLRLNSFTKKYIKNILARITGYIEEQTGVASN